MSSRKIGSTYDIIFFSRAMSNSIDKEDFMHQFESIVAAIKQNKQKVEKRRTEERNRRDKLCKQLLDLVEQQRNYVCIVKQLRIECKRNEELLAYFRKQSWSLPTYHARFCATFVISQIPMSPPPLPSCR